MPRVIATTEWAHEGYFRTIHKAGAKHLVITPDTPLEDFDDCDGLLVPGGRDVWPGWYGEDFGPKTQPADMARDSLELALIKRALTHNMPILGVCRGHQLLNVAMGGSLYQHISKHVGFSHPTTIKKASEKLAFISEERTSFSVNSLHHQAVDKLGTGLRIAAVAHDGTVEAIEGTKHSWVMGVQWHPELSHTPRFNREMQKLVYDFVHAA